MTTPTILPKVDRPSAEKIKGDWGVALLKAKNAHCRSLEDLAVRVGKTDPKSASDYISGTTKMDIVALVLALTDPDMGGDLRAAFGAIVGCDMSPLSSASGACTAAHILPLSDALTRLVQMTHPESEGGTAAVDAELIANGEAIDAAGLAMDEMRVALSAARARVRGRHVKAVA